MRRWIFNAAAGLSLVLLVGTVGLWVDSNTNARRLIYHRPRGESFISSEAGSVVFDLVERPARTSSTPTDRWTYWRYSPRRATRMTQTRLDRYRWGFGYGWAKTVPIRAASYAFAVPHWLFALLFAVLPLVWGIKRWRSRVPPGHCKRCGYDLRASEERCPECGMPIPDREADEERR